MNLKFFYVKKTDSIIENESSLFDACMQTAAFSYREYNNDKYLLDILLSLLNEEGYGIGEWSSIQISLDEEPVEPICIENEFNERPYIVFNYGHEYLVIKLDRGIKLMTDWCYEKLTFKPDSNIAMLLKKLNDKYAI